MKNKMFLLFILLAFIIGSIIKTDNNLFANRLIPTGHLLYDEVDNELYCVGTPVGCVF